MFGECDNFRTESITFDMAHFDLPYNTILGCPALAMFMAAVHYACSMLKIPGPTGIISKFGPLGCVIPYVLWFVYCMS